MIFLELYDIWSFQVHIMVTIAGWVVTVWVAVELWVGCAIAR